jgi:signal transduction histidine kinase
MAATAPVIVQPLAPGLLEQLGRTLHKLKHDLSNSLVAAMGELELLATDVDDVELAERLQDARAKLLRPFLDLRRMMTSLPVADGGGPRWNDMQQSLDARARAVDVTLAWQPEALELLQTDARLRPVLAALLTNALDAATAGVTVTVAFTASAQAATLRVTDDGPGCENLEAAAHGQLQRAGGVHLGLGLAVAASLLAERGGQLTLESVQAHGFQAAASWPTA